MSTYRPTIRDDIDLERAWRIIAPPEEPRPHALWIMLIGEGNRAFTGVVQVEDVFEVPPPERAHVLPDFVRELAVTAGGPVERVAFLRTRPGLFGPSDDDLPWADCLHGIARSVGLGCATVFLATDVIMVPLPSNATGSLASA